MSHHPPERIEIEAEAVRDRFSQVVAVLIVLATLTGAVIEFLHERDNDRSSQAALEAQRYAIQAPAEAATAEQKAMVSFENFALAEEQRTAGASAFQGRLDPAAHPMAGDDRRLTLEEIRWGKLAQATQAGLPITTTNQYGPEADPYFPYHFLTDAQVTADRASALEDAANEERGLWSAKATDYVAIITVVAVALYLLGLSLTIHLAVRRVLAGVGLALVVVAIGWSVTVYARPVAKPSDRAADEFAQGRHALALAYLRTDQSGYAEAYDHYSAAIRIRPTFARAYLDRSIAAFEVGSPQRAQFVSVSTPDALAKSLSDLEKARSLGLVDKRVLNNLGANYILRGLQDRRQADYEKAVGYLDQAIKLDSTDPLLHGNKAVALLLLGRQAEALAEEQRSADLTVYLPPPSKSSSPSPSGGAKAPKRTLRADPYFEEQLVGGALTELDRVARVRTDLAGRVKQLQDLVAGAVELQGASPGPARTPGKVKVDVFPATLQWVAAIPDLKDGDLVAQQWYQLDSQKRGWAVLPDISGTMARCTTTPQFDCLRQNPQGQWFVTSRYLSGTALCLTDGTFRVDLYINGHLAATGEQPSDSDLSFSSLQPEFLTDLGVGMCRPRDWSHMKASQRGYVDGFVSADGKRGLYVFKYQHPSLVGTQAQAATDGLTRSVTGLASLYPGSPQAQQSGTIQYLMGLAGVQVTLYTYSGGQVIAEAGSNPDHSVIAVAIFGDTAWMNGSEPFHILDSLIQR